MSEVESNINVTESKAQAVLKGLKAGKTREEIAKELDYANDRSLDAMMRRHNYVWNRNEQMYYHPGQEIQIMRPVGFGENRSQTSKVLQLFQQGMDARLVAEKVGYTSYREMAIQMKEKGYVWDDQQNNYTMLETQDPCDSSEVHPSRQSRQSGDSIGTIESSRNRTWQQYLPTLQWLEDNIEFLEDMIATTDGSGNNVAGIIPRYAVPGVFVTKSIHMSNQLDQLVRDFSTGRNISQRDIFAAALLEYLRKYGYKQEVDVFLAVH